MGSLQRGNRPARRSCSRGREVAVLLGGDGKLGSPAAGSGAHALPGRCGLGRGLDLLPIEGPGTRPST